MVKFKVSDEDGAAADFVVCTRVTTPLHFADNLTGVCCQCGAAIQFRPHLPTKPRKLCMQCFAKQHTDEDTIVATKRTVEEVILYRSKPKGRA